MIGMDVVTGISHLQTERASSSNINIDLPYCPATAQ